MQTAESVETSGGRRTFLDIATAIVNACRPGASRTRVLYNANLNFRQLKKYLQVLETSRLIAFDAEYRVYKTTEKGRKFLFHQKELESAIAVADGNRKILYQLLENEPAVDLK